MASAVPSTAPTAVPSETSSIRDPEKALETRPLSHTTSHRSADKEQGPVGSTPADADDGMEYPKGIRLIGVVVALILSIFLVALDMTIIATAIPRITDEFHSLNDVGWYGSAFFLTVASFQSTWGKAYKYFSMKPAFLLAIFVFEIGSLICAVAKDSTTLIVGRAIAGAGGAGIASGAYTIIALSAPPAQRPAFTGILGATYGVASVIGPLLGGVFTQKVSWRWCFYINLPIGGVAAAIIFMTFKTPKAVKPAEASIKEKLLQMDLVGTFTIMAAVICYLLALQWGGVTKSWKDSSVIGTLVGFVLLLIAFGVNEYFMGERALLQSRILKNRIIIVAIVYVIFIAGVFFTFLYYLPIYFQSISGVTPSESGIRNLPLILSISLFTIISGGLITATGHYVPIIIVASVFATIGSGLLYTLDINTPSSKWIGYQIVCGVGLGLGFQVPIIVSQASVDISDISSVSAVLLFFQTIGGSFFVSAGETAFENVLVQNLKFEAPTLDAAQVVATGATNIRSAFPDQLAGILLSYLAGLRVTFAMAIALGGLSLIAACFAPWRKINAMAAMGGG